MKVYTIKNYKGNLLESIKNFQNTHKNMRIVEAFEEMDSLMITAEPKAEQAAEQNMSEPKLSPIHPEEDVAAKQVEETDPIMNFGCRLLFFSVLVHFWHLNCSRNSQHVALQDLYEACTDTADALLEARIGMLHKPIEKCDGYERMAATSLAFNQGSIDNICNVQAEAEALSNQDFGNGISNILDDFSQTCNSVIYKLTRLT